MRPSVLHAITALGLVGAALGCGGGGDSPTSPKSSNSFTAAEAQLVAANLFVEISHALATTSGSSSVAPASRSAAAGPTTITQTVNGTCTAGGTIKGTFVVTTDLNSSGSGTQSANVSVTSAGCKVSTGSRSIAVNGNFTLSYNVSFANYAVASNFTWRETGNFTWEGGSCAIDYTAIVTPQGKTSITGSFCGQNISYSN